MSSSTALRWWHVMWGTHRSWLPGDARGFRSKEHRIHSSGDYRQPPPITEHAGLRDYHAARGGGGVAIPTGARLAAARAIGTAWAAMGFRVAVVSVGVGHVHGVAELPLELREFRKAVGKAKLLSSRAIGDWLPGTVWDRGDHHLMIRDADHYASVCRYVRDKQGAGHATWTGKGFEREAR